MVADGERIIPLRTAVEAATSQVNRDLFTVATFGAYLLLTIAATSHTQLLVGDQITLPILNIEVSLVTFFVVAPAIFFSLVVKLLCNIRILAERVQLLEFEIDQLPLKSVRTFERTITVRNLFGAGL